MRKELKLTSVKVDAKLFEDFKIEYVRRKYTLNKLVNTAIVLYLKEEEYRDIKKAEKLFIQSINKRHLKRTSTNYQYFSLQHKYPLIPPCFDL